jgi:nicotinamide mononucleotide transporter
MRSPPVSLVAQALLNWKKLENWYFWITADIVYVPLYVVKRLDLKAIVYVLFLSMCFLGLREWAAAERAHLEAMPTPLRVEAELA